MWCYLFFFVLVFIFGIREAGCTFVAVQTSILIFFARADAYLAVINRDANCARFVDDWYWHSRLLFVLYFHCAAQYTTTRSRIVNVVNTTEDRFFSE